jgi:hypothetical protein
MMELWGEQGADRSPTEDDVKTLLEMVIGEDGQPVDFRRKLLGDAHDQMVEDGLSGEALQRISNVVMAYYGLGEHVAKAILASPGEAPARPNRAARRTTAKKTAGGKSRQVSGGTASRTRRQGSPGSSTSPSVRKVVAKAV